MMMGLPGGGRNDFTAGILQDSRELNCLGQGETDEAILLAVENSGMG
jgi:hypothetical protein